MTRLLISLFLLSLCALYTCQGQLTSGDLKTLRGFIKSGDSTAFDSQVKTITDDETRQTRVGFQEIMDALSTYFDKYKFRFALVEGGKFNVRCHTEAGAKKPINFFPKQQGHEDLTRAQVTRRKAGARKFKDAKNTGELLGIVHDDDRLSNVEKFETLCTNPSHKIPKSRQSGLYVLRQSTWVRCGPTALTMFLLDNKDNGCRVPDGCDFEAEFEAQSKGSSSYWLSQKLNEYCGGKFKMVSLPARSEIPTDFNTLIINFQAHFLMASKVGNNYFLRDPFCGLEIGLPLSEIQKNFSPSLTTDVDAIVLSSDPRPAIGPDDAKKREEEQDKQRKEREEEEEKKMKEKEEKKMKEKEEKKKMKKAAEEDAEKQSAHTPDLGHNDPRLTPNLGHNDLRQTLRGNDLRQTIRGNDLRQTIRGNDLRQTIRGNDPRLTPDLGHNDLRQTIRGNDPKPTPNLGHNDLRQTMRGNDLRSARGRVPISNPDEKKPDDARTNTDHISLGQTQEIPKQSGGDDLRSARRGRQKPTNPDEKKIHT